MPAPTDPLVRKAKGKRFAAGTGEGAQVKTATHTRTRAISGLGRDRATEDDRERGTISQSQLRRRSSGRPRPSSELLGNRFSLSPGSLLRYLKNGTSGHANHGSDETQAPSQELPRQPRSSWPTVREGIVTWDDLASDNNIIDHSNLNNLTSDAEPYSFNSEEQHTSQAKKRGGKEFRLLPKVSVFMKSKKNKKPPQQPDPQPTPQRSSIVRRLFHRKAKETLNDVPVPYQSSTAMANSLVAPIPTFSHNSDTLVAPIVPYSENDAEADRTSQLIPAPQLPCGPNMGRFAMDGANDIDDTPSSRLSFSSRDCSEQTLTSVSPLARPTQNLRKPNFGLDGTYDGELPSPVRSLDLNKALPPQPLQPRAMRLSNIRIGTPSLTYSEEERFWPLSASTGSPRETSILRSPSRKRFEQTTRELINPTDADTHALTTFEFDLGQPRRSDASRYDPRLTRRSPNTYVLWVPLGSTLN